MHKTVLALASCLFAGCATMTPQELAATPSGSLCIAYARAILNSNRDAWLQEVYRRGETCAPYAAEMAVVGAQSQASLSAMNARYLPAPQPAQPQAPAHHAGGITGFLQGSSIEGQSRFCRYAVLGRTHILTIPAVQLCPLTVQVGY